MSSLQRKRTPPQQTEIGSPDGETVRSDVNLMFNIYHDIRSLQFLSPPVEVSRNCLSKFNYDVSFLVDQK